MFDPSASFPRKLCVPAIENFLQTVHDVFKLFARTNEFWFFASTPVFKRLRDCHNYHDG